LGPWHPLRRTTRGGAAGAPFIESVHLLDKDGRTIGGGRWNQGRMDLRANAYEFECQFEVQSSNPVVQVKAVVAGKYEVEEVTFPVTGLLQQ